MALVLNLVDACGELPPLKAEGLLSAHSQIGFWIAFYTAQTLAAFFSIRFLLLLTQYNFGFLRHVRYSACLPCHSDDVTVGAIGNVTSTQKPGRGLGFPIETQVFGVLATGIVILVTTRVRNLELVGGHEAAGAQDCCPSRSAATFLGALEELAATKSPLGDIGQVLLLVGWSVMVLAVLTPALVKFLPIAALYQKVGFRTFVRRSFFRRPRFTTTDYFDAFSGSTPLSDSRREIFSRLSFWPCSDGRMRVLFFLIWTLWLYFLVPLTPTHALSFSLFLVALIVVAGKLAGFSVEAPKRAFAWFWLDNPAAAAGWDIE